MWWHPLCHGLITLQGQGYSNVHAHPTPAVTDRAQIPRASRWPLVSSKKLLPYASLGYSVEREHNGAVVVLVPK